MMAAVWRPEYGWFCSATAARPGEDRQPGHASTSGDDQIRPAVLQLADGAEAEETCQPGKFAPALAA